jgi:hypothetical protein
VSDEHAERHADADGADADVDAVGHEVVGEWRSCRDARDARTDTTRARHVSSFR